MILNERIEKEYGDLLLTSYTSEYDKKIHYQIIDEAGDVICDYDNKKEALKDWEKEIKEYQQRIKR